MAKPWEAVSRAAVARPSYIYASTLNRRERAWRGRRTVRAVPARTVVSGLGTMGLVGALIARLLGT